MKMKTNVIKNRKGFSLIELVVVFAIIALVMAGVTYSIGAGRKSSKANDVAQKMRTIEIGLYEYKSAKGNLPLLATSGAFPAGLNPYIPAEIRNIYRYKCNNTDNKVVITSDAMADPTEAGDIAARLQNMNLCSTATANANNTIDCVLKTFDGSAQCT